MDERRITMLNEAAPAKGPVIYWMQRDQRAADNWALIYAQKLAVENDVPLLIVFCLTDSFLKATLRHYAFMLKGLEVTAAKLSEKNIPLVLLEGNPEEEIPEFVNEVSAGYLVTDFNPLKLVLAWKSAVAAELKIPFIEVDAHNIVPCRVASDKAEFGAYTIRPKIQKLLPEFLTEIPPIIKMNDFGFKPTAVDADSLLSSLNLDRKVPEVGWIIPGESAALDTLNEFIDFKIENYDSDRNDPNKNAVSNLSPYLHFGQISAQRVALTVESLPVNEVSKSAFLEQLIIRRELSDNFCYYNSNYDSFEGFPEWARISLNEHRKDEREYIYSIPQFEKGATHDNLWNAAQSEMVNTGKMQSYMRMYWAKKIYEWSSSPEDALAAAIYLNDRYELDGRDPNGYTGIGWSIGGVHDRPWFERPVFGKIRYMNYNGCAKKFDVKEYIGKNLNQRS